MFDIPNDVDMVVDVYRRAAEENRSDPLLRGSTLHFPNYGQLVLNGDMHGNIRNFDKLVRFCMLGGTPGRHVILQELIHEEPGSPDLPDMSHVLLYETAHWKCAFPEQVHFLQSNHELAQLTDQEITKNGRSVIRDFEEGVARTFGRNHMPQVIEAIKDFISSFPLAARTVNKLFFSHSLPASDTIDTFDPTILDRELTVDDLMQIGSVYALVWGRRHPPELIEELARTLQVELFICGHQPQEMGFGVLHPRLLIVASDHSHGTFLPINLNRKYTMDDLVRSLRKYVSVE
ncbi:MAG: hypothetical protein HJJLKODD_01685 [Phycisphaerae bacterium]|nr:hypothetical protein [Phycisphaerae bacterium]